MCSTIVAITVHGALCLNPIVTGVILDKHPKTRSSSPFYIRCARCIFIRDCPSVGPIVHPTSVAHFLHHPVLV